MIHIPCPSELWDSHIRENWSDEFVCRHCGSELLEEDPENDHASPWWEDFCSEVCRETYTAGHDEWLAKQAEWLAKQPESFFYDGGLDNEQVQS